MRPPRRDRLAARRARHPPATLHPVGGEDGEPTWPGSFYPIALFPHGVLLRELGFRNNFSRQRIDIHSPISKNLDAVVAIDHCPIRSGLERSRLSWFERVYKFLVREFIVLIEF